MSRVVRGVWREAVAGRVRDGGLHDFGWPAGLSTLVAIGTAAAMVAALAAVGSGWLRRTGDLVTTAPGDDPLPRGGIWLLLTLVVLAAALFLQGAIRGPWWLRVLGLLVVGQLMSIFGIRGLDPDERVASLVSAAALVLLVAFCLVRMGRAFAWWEFSVLALLVATPLVAGLVQLGLTSRVLGFEFTPAFLRQSLSLASTLVLPLFVAAGFAIADLAVGLTVSAVRQVQRLPGGPWPYALLALVVVVRLGQTGWELTRGRLAGDGVLTFAPALAVAAGLGLVALGLRAARRPAVAVDLHGLPEQAGRIAVPVGVSLVSLYFLVVVIVFVQSTLSQFELSYPGERFSADVIARLGDDPTNVLIAAVLLGWGWRQARAGQAAYALVLGCTGVVMLGLAIRFVTAYRWPVELDVDALNLVATGVTLAVAGWYLVRRGLSPTRAISLAGLLILSALFSYRDLLTDPVGELLGYTGAGLVLFGIGWDFLTGSAWGNRASRAFPTPTRVLLVVVKLLAPAILLAYAALSRAPASGGDLDAYARLGSQVLGTALLAAAYLAVLALVVRDQPLTPEKRPRVSAVIGVSRGFAATGGFLRPRR